MKGSGGKSCGYSDLSGTQSSINWVMTAGSAQGKVKRDHPGFPRIGKVHIGGQRKSPLETLLGPVSMMEGPRGQKMFEGKNCGGENHLKKGKRIGGEVRELDMLKQKYRALSRRLE